MEIDNPPKLILFVDPGVNSSGMVLMEDNKLILSKTIETKKGVKPNQLVNMAWQIATTINKACWGDTPELSLLVYEEPNLSGRFLSRSQRTMDRFIGALMYAVNDRGGCLEFVGVHPMTLKAFYGAARTDKLDMAIKAGGLLPPDFQEALLEAIEKEEFDTTDAFALAGRYFALQKGIQKYEE